MHIVQAGISELSTGELASLMKGCDAVISCLGHNLSLKGMFGKPRRLVTDSIAKTSAAIAQLRPAGKTKLILMNSTGCTNPDANEQPPLSQRFAVALIRYMIPPHVDNEKAAQFLREQIGQKHELIEWVAIRPDSLTHEAEVTAYDLQPSPTRNAIFDAGATSRINVAHFMSRLISDDKLWKKWKGQMPVIYNA